MNSMQSKKLNYGLDAPGLVRWFLIGGAALILLNPLVERLPVSQGLRDFLSTFWPGVWLFITGLLMVWSSYWGKFIARDKLIERLSLKGSESVLDLGCGRGLLLLGAAKKLPQGKAIGVDLWSNVDLSSNSRDAVMNNAKLENVLDRIEIIDGDMRKLPFGDSSIDCITASMSIHNIPTREGRSEAIKEVARVLKPGGKIALLDFKFTSQYADDCKAFGLANVERTPISFWNFPPSRTVVGEKPDTGRAPGVC